MLANNVLLLKIYPVVEKGLSQPGNSNRLKQDIGRYLDRNMEKLSTAGPTKRIVFNEGDMDVIYKAAEIDPDYIRAEVKNSAWVIGKYAPVLGKPFNSAIVMALRYYMLKNQKDMVNATLTYLTLSLYPSLFFKYFRKAEPNENIMNYTINNMSNKFKIKQMGTVLHALVDTAQVCMNTNSARIKRCTDQDILDFIQDLMTRINSFLKKIANEFFENHKNDRYINLEMDNYEEDNFRESDNNAYAIERLTNAITLKLVVGGPRIDLINVAARLCQVSVNELRNYVNTMVTNEQRDDIHTVVESILFLFVYNDQHTIQEVNSNKFLLYCSETYKKSNTTDKNILKIKAILDKWLEELGTYKKTQRLATINDFRRALFLFFVMSIQANH